jgi:hypothetical protein
MSFFKKYFYRRVAEGAENIDFSLAGDTTKEKSLVALRI